MADDIPDVTTPRFQELDQKTSRNQYELQENMLALLYERAAERFKTLEVKDFEQITNEMMDILAEKEKLEYFDEELYRKLIKQIVVHKDSTVKVIFQNGSSTKVRYGMKKERVDNIPKNGSKIQTGYGIRPKSGKEKRWQELQ